MKQLFNIFLVAFLFAITSCNTQKLVLKVNDAKKLETNKDKFIGKPLKNVLSEIKPKKNLCMEIQKIHGQEPLAELTLHLVL